MQRMENFIVDVPMRKYIQCKGMQFKSLFKNNIYQ